MYYFIPFVPDSVVLALCAAPIFVLFALDIHADNKDKRRAKVAARVRRAEVRRRAMAAMAASRRERANKCAGRYHGLV